MLILSQGTLTELLKTTLGNYFGELSINYYTNFSKGEDVANNNLANIATARVVNTSEVGTVGNNEGQKFITSKLKMLSGGDTITCRRGFSSQQLSFKAGKLWIQTNIMPTFTGKNTDNTSLKERIEILEFPFSYVDDDELVESSPEKYKKRQNNIKTMFQTPVYGFAMFQLLLSYVPMVLGIDVAYPFNVKMAKLRFFDAVGDELGNWFKANYCLEDVSEGAVLSVLNLKDVMVHFKEFAGSKTAVGAFNNAIIRMCGKRVDGSAGYFINRNDHMLQGYVRIVDAVADVVAETEVEHVAPAVNAMAM
jgi:hypothetical protein